MNPEADILFYMDESVLVKYAKAILVDKIDMQYLEDKELRFTQIGQGSEETMYFILVPTEMTAVETQADDFDEKYGTQNIIDKI